MIAARCLAADHDVLLVDLDGTLRLAGKPIPYAADSVREAADRGARALIVTNNPSRSPQQLAESLARMDFAVAPADIVTSGQVAATMLAGSHPAGTRVLVIGTDALGGAVADAGLVPVRSADDQPAAVVQGHSPDTSWGDLAEACIAIRAGVDWVATNTDPTLPTDRGLLPGNGSMVAALVTATDRHPRVAGKPGRELLDAAAARAGATRPLVVGDRLDTDIAAAVAAGMASLFVLTGVSTAADLLAAPESMRPTFVAADLRGLVDPRASIRLADGDDVAAGPHVPDGHHDRAGDDPVGDDPAGDGADTCGDRGGAPKTWAVTTADDHLELSSGRADSGQGSTEDRERGDAVAALAALVTAAWRTGVTRVRAADPRSAAVLHTLRLD